MTLVVAINLTNRLYLAADTRVSRRVGNDHKIITDNQLKVEPLTNHLMVACAGNANMASYVVRELKNSELSNQPTTYWRKNIKEEIAKVVGNYLLLPEVNDYEECEVVMIFAGIDPSHHQEIDYQRFWDLIDAFSNTIGQQGKRELERRLGNKHPKDFSQRDVQIMHDVMTTAPQMGMLPEMMEALSNKGVSDGILEIPSLPKSFVFAIEIKCSNDIPDKEKIKIHDYPWGSYAVYGHKLSEKNIPKKLLLDLEFNMRNAGIDKDNLLMTTRICENFSDTIGGCVINYRISSEGFSFKTGKLVRMDPGTEQQEVMFETDAINGRIYRKHTERWIPLQPLSALYSMKDSLQLKL